MKNDRRTKTELIRDLDAFHKKIKRLENDIKKLGDQEKRGRDSLRRQHTLWEGSQDALVVTEIDSRIIAANTSMCTLTAYSRKELLCKYLHELVRWKGSQPLSELLRSCDCR